MSKYKSSELREWALEQVEALDQYIKKELKTKTKPNKCNPLLNMNGTWALGIHVGLYGWPEGESEFNDIKELIEWCDVVEFRHILNDWGVDPSCVIGGYDCRDKHWNTYTDQNDEIPTYIEEFLLPKVRDLDTLDVLSELRCTKACMM